MTPDIPVGYSLFRADLDHVDEHLGSAVESLRGARIFLTGGTGFFGIWLVQSLLWLNERHRLGLDLTVLSRNPQRFLETSAPFLRDRKELRFASGSIRDFDSATGPFSHIIHAASETNPDGGEDWAARFLASSLDGTRRLLDMAAKHRPEAILLTTSGAVYGQMDHILDQRCVEGPGSIADMTSEKAVYGQTKRMMEIMAAVAAKEGGYRALPARCFCFVGPYLPLASNYAIGNFIRDALAGQDIVVGGDGTPLRSYLYSADLVVWLLTILLRGQSGRPYNVGGEAAVSIAGLARAVMAAAGGKGSVVIRQAPVQGRPVNAYLPDVTRVASELGLQTRINLANAIARTLAWHRQPDAAR